MIPDAAVEAAEAAWLGVAFESGSWTLKNNLRAALEAAAPHMNRTITTAEELDALPAMSVVLDRLDICYRLYSDPAYKEPAWCVVGETSPSRPHGWLPATVIYRPQE